jgi:hypothetical protein
MNDQFLIRVQFSIESIRTKGSSIAVVLSGLIAVTILEAISCSIIVGLFNVKERKNSK